MTFCTLQHARRKRLYDGGVRVWWDEQELSAPAAIKGLPPARRSSAEEKKAHSAKKVLRRRLILIVRIRPPRRKI